MNLNLITDFRDYYDHAFDQNGAEFQRMSCKGMDRRSMLDFLHSKCFRTPTYGTVEEIVPRLLAEFDESIQQMAAESIVDIVVHTDPTVHCGEGKIKISAAEALDKYPQHLGVEYIPATKSGFGRSLRYLQVGIRRWWLEYWSLSDWRSNVGEGDCRIITEETPGYHAWINKAMFAIDFVSAGSHIYAIDFNIAPNLSPLQGVLTPHEVVGLLKEAWGRSERFWEPQ